MKIKHCHPLLFLCLIAVIFSCKKDMDTAPVIPPADTEFNIPAATPVTGRVSGIVVDENNAPVQNAAVVLSGLTYTTDANGFFNTGNKVLDKYITTVTATKAGYFKAFRSFSATESRNYVSFKLIPKTLSGSVDAAAGGSVSLSNGTTITMQSNGIVIKGTGVAYTGPVNVYAAYLDPTSADIAATVPGSMMGQDAEHMFVLQSTGMIAVNLESPGGQALQLATGKTANISLPIPASLLSKAPATIDTWSLDDRGVWIKEGIATKNGNAYDMQVTHFSFWNADAPVNAIYLTLHVHDQNGNPLPNTHVQLIIPNSTLWWATTYGNTDSSGTVSGLVPSGQGLQMSLFPNMFTCNSPFSHQDIGPFTGDTTLNITVTLNSTEHTVVSGTVNKCNSQPLQHGTATVYAGYSVYNTPVLNGSYTITIPYCSGLASLSVVVTDSTNEFASSGSIPVTSTSVTVPLITLCGGSQNAAFTISSCNAMGSYIIGTPLNQSNYIVMYVNVTVPGPYNIPVASINGMQFTGSGNLTHIGQDTIIVQGTGTPLQAISTNLTLGSPGQTCSALIQVEWGTAVITMSCNNIIVHGNYTVGFPMTTGNDVWINVNVTTIGYFSITTDTANGLYFSGQGLKTVTGPTVVTLSGHGTLLSATQFTYLVNGSGCNFQVTPSSTGPSNGFTFYGAPNACTAFNIGGTFQAGVPLNAQNILTLSVDVSFLGNYSIYTNTNNGISFAATGNFSSTGLQLVYLQGIGTPLNAGPATFIPAGSTPPGCTFVVTTN